jgi:hemoglobin/transferrin/lactoferrin receptor protein
VNTRLTVLALLLVPTFAAAEDFLDPLVLTASRAAVPLSEAAHTVSVVDLDEIRQNTRRTLPEALQLVPGVLVQKTAHGHGSPFIRGFTGRQNLLLVDGVRINNSLWRGGPVQYWNTIDPLSLERFELVKSHGSVLYGSDAVGGTLNAITRSAGFRDESHGAFFHHGSAYYEYRSNGSGSHIGRLESTLGVGGKWGLALGISAKEFGDIEDSAVGLMRNTGHPEQDLDLRFDFALDEASTITLAHYRVDQDDIWRWHRTVFNPGWYHNGHLATPGSFNSNIYDQERTLSYLRYQRTDPRDDAPIRRVAATVSFQTTSDTESQDRRPTDRRLQHAGVDTLGFDLELESPLGPGTLVYGADYYHDSVDSVGFRDRGAGLAFDPSFRPVADDSEYDLFGLFAHYRWEATDTLRVDGGARYTWAEADLGRNWDPVSSSDISVTRSWDEAVFSLRAIQDLSDTWSVYGGASQAFRAPNLDDLSGNITSRSGIAAAGSIDVEPETFITYELGTRHVTADTYFNVAVFYTDITDIITSVPVAAGSASNVTTNGQDGYLYGIEAEGSWRFHPHWTLSGFVAWQYGKTATESFVGGPVIKQPVSRLLPLSGSLALRWTHPSERFWIEGRVLAASEADTLSNNDLADTQRIPVGGTPAYSAAMLHAGWQVNDHFELTLGLENLTDTDYRTHGSGQNEPGFNAIVGLRALW